METKAEPNANGCLARALPDEPFLVLLARDPCAPTAIRFWADQRAQLGVESDRRQDAEQLTEALETADAMEQWRIDNDGKWRNSPVCWVPALGEEVRVREGSADWAGDWEHMRVWVVAIDLRPEGGVECTVVDAWPLTPGMALTDGFVVGGQGMDQLRPMTAEERRG